MFLFDTLMEMIYRVLLDLYFIYFHLMTKYHLLKLAKNSPPLYSHKIVADAYPSPSLEETQIRTTRNKDFFS